MRTFHYYRFQPYISRGIPLVSKWMVSWTLCGTYTPHAIHKLHSLYFLLTCWELKSKLGLRVPCSVPDQCIPVSKKKKKMVAEVLLCSERDVNNVEAVFELTCIDSKDLVFQHKRFQK